MSSMPHESSAPTNGDAAAMPVGEEAEEAAAPASAVENSDKTSGSRVLEYLREARQEDAEQPNGSAFRKYKLGSGPPVDEDLPVATNGAASPAASYSTPDDTPSLRGSVISSIAGSVQGSRFSPSPSLRPFDQRFQSRLHPGSPLHSPSGRSPSPAFFGAHSRTSSAASRLDNVDIEALDDHSTPWDVIRWTKLKKISSQLFSEAGRRNFGSPTCITVSATIAIGTSKGIILIFDYHQVLKAIIGTGSKAVECGSVTALAVSADHTTVAAGHSQGHIFTWEIAKPSRPFLTIQPITVGQDGKADGHVEGVSVLHLGFLGTRHTALVSGDDSGMAFSHLATRGLGAVGRTVRTTRILGRYPFDVALSGRPRKPSTALGLAILPLGSSPEPTDTMGLTAMLTPYLLVIVSTTPIAQTQYKCPRPKQSTSDNALSGCLAWYPSVRLKKGPSNTEYKSSRAKLAYCWSDVLTVLDLIVVEPSQPEDTNRPPQLDFHTRCRFRFEEAIVAVQWISRQIIGVLTMTQRLVIIEDNNTELRMTETFDLMSKHIVHSNVFAEKLSASTEGVDRVYGDVAGAFYNSFKSHKGRMFLLCSYDLSVGALSNWADRLLALMEVGDFIGAINLATTYYSGESNKLTVGLPEEPSLRMSVVEEKLLEMMLASLRYAFGKNTNSSRTEILGQDKLRELASACFEACLSMNAMDFLFDEAFEFFEQGLSMDIFFETLEPYILSERVTVVPTPIIKSLLTHYASLGLEERLEEMVCHLDTRTLDIDQVTKLCKQHALYDAMIYVYNRALDDYIIPLIDLLSLVLPPWNGEGAENQHGMNAVSALKVFPYLSYTLTGRVYPTGDDLSEIAAANSKAQIYYFFFNGSTVRWPRGSKTAFKTSQDAQSEPPYPYLHLILKFDAPSFLSALNEAFEDPFLNGYTQSDALDERDIQALSEDQLFGRSLNRQYIVNILMEVMDPDNFPAHDYIYLYMFIARNVPKFPQFLILPGSMLHKVLVGLCNPPGEDIAGDCELSVETLLTVYRPPDMDVFVELFSNAHFYRVLKTIFRAEKQYARLLKACFDDEDAPEAVFDCIYDCLRPGNSLQDRQLTEVKRVIREQAVKALHIDLFRTAHMIELYAPDLHPSMLAALEEQPRDQFLYLGAILEPETTDGGEKPDLKRPKSKEYKEFAEKYIQLMCKFDPDHVSDYAGRLQSGDLRLEKVLPAMESSGVMDAAVVLMAREGQIRQAMDRLLAHLTTLETAFVSVVTAAPNVEDIAGANQAATETVQSLQKYARVGVWLCQGQMKTAHALQKPAAKGRRRPINDELTKEEVLWLDILDTVVRVAKKCMGVLRSKDSNATTPTAESTEQEPFADDLQRPELIQSVRQFVQETFSTLLVSTSSSASTATNTVSFLHVLRAFLSRASLASPSLADLRSVLQDVFEAYAFEKQVLALENQLLNKDLFGKVEEASRRRQRGWRPASQSCEHCGKRMWGAGAPRGIYAAWERVRAEKLRRAEQAREQRRLEADAGGTKLKGKGKLDEGGDVKDETEDDAGGALIVFNCSHAFHRKCLVEQIAAQQPSAAEDVAFRCIICAGTDEVNNERWRR